MKDEWGGIATARPSQLEGAYHWFHRLIALACLAMGIFYWVRLLGVYPGLLWRFDLMPIHWQVACLVLAVLYPFAAVGLWLLASWGPVIWFLCAGGEIAMFGPFAAYFGQRNGLLAFHVLVAAIYVAFRVTMHLRKRRAAV
ncbi:DUF6163 family protein [Nitratireductor pacificus]|uniref:Transmembrane protein n=1 Tax=Nitratireductor pacificus pht-3B TaxID=391937 RepID=K2MHP3_9HYPH|nr:DUF6163 family protein [Nitratireductor pacificus]EKF20265.1 hypothetical protein NA2_03387 [Nitratireductor pacificus pht-3B]